MSKLIIRNTVTNSGAQAQAEEKRLVKRLTRPESSIALPSGLGSTSSPISVPSSPEDTVMLDEAGAIPLPLSRFTTPASTTLSPPTVGQAHEGTRTLSPSLALNPIPEARVEVQEQKDSVPNNIQPKLGKASEPGSALMPTVTTCFICKATFPSVPDWLKHQKDCPLPAKIGRLRSSPHPPSRPLKFARLTVPKKGVVFVVDHPRVNATLDRYNLASDEGAPGLPRTSLTKTTAPLMARLVLVPSTIHLARLLIWNGD
ncbi:hypothetical protein EJ06DRAFT_570471 [Trichodelitschia bisporula]|uniref:Uncharacterized protein n=1 Tax=Trichodelitschia bisporula TaxID=703511 RepID=A0A6G1HJE5_9PEZI|nr:hypothetical protein EJ06DRAFT_570471 [Trichodelitschia bisporula]